MPWLAGLLPQHAVLIGAGFATFGWLYTARRQRTLARKQHTLNVILQARNSKEFGAAQAAIRPDILSKCCPDIANGSHEHKEHYRMVLNHYELVAMGIRNGDFDERMVKDIQRGTLLAVWEACETNIFKMRDARRRRTTYEHFEWLYKRWETKRPGLIQKFVEWMRGAPLGGRRVDPHE
jgi:hypothetical protein